MASSAISIDTIRQSIGGGFGVTAPGPGDGDTGDGESSDYITIDTALMNYSFGDNIPMKSQQWQRNVLVGKSVLESVIDDQEAEDNVGVGVSPFQQMTGGSGNVAIGIRAGSNSAGSAFTSNNCVAIGYEANTYADQQANYRIAIGAGAHTSNDDSIQLGANYRNMRLYCGNKGAVALQSQINVIAEALEAIRIALKNVGASDSDTEFPGREALEEIQS